MGGKCLILLISLTILLGKRDVNESKENLWRTSLTLYKCRRGRAGKMGMCLAWVKDGDTVY